MKKVLVIGASGLVGSRFVELANDKLQITSVDEKTLDILQKDSIAKYFEENSFDAVINFAAFTNVDAAEKERGDESGIAFRLNTLAPKNIAEECKNHNKFLVHISTDFVFTGDESNPGPYSEDSVIPDSMEGIGWYGWTKNRAEKEVLNSGSKNAIIRYGYPFRADNFELKVDWARNLIKIYNEQKLYPLFTDMIQSIVLIDDLVDPMVKIISEESAGIFHIASHDTVTPHEIGEYLLEKYSGKKIEVQKGSMIEFLKAPGRTPRPRLGGLKTEETEEKLGMRFRTSREMVDDFVTRVSK